MGITNTADIELSPPWTPEGHLRAHEWYAALQEKGPVAIDQQSGIWQFLGYDAVREFLFHPENWSTAKRLETVPQELRVVRLLTSDPPQHLKLRSHFSSAYRPKRSTEMAERVRSVCSALIDKCLEKREFDLIADFAKPLTVTMISEIIGIPDNERHYMHPLMADSYLGRVDTSGDGSLKKALYPGGAQPGSELIFPYLEDLIARRRAAPEDDLISALVQIQPGQMKERLDIPALLTEQFGAGQNTTVHVFGSLILMLDRNRDQYRRLRQNPDLMPSAVEEAIRLHSPLQARPRIAMHDITLPGGETIREGAVGLGWIGAANVDSAQFERPMEFDPGRNPNPHIGFGYGEHFCLGAHLARLELRIALETWQEKIGDFEQVDDSSVGWLDDFIVHGLRQYRIRVKPTGATA